MQTDTLQTLPVLPAEVIRIIIDNVYDLIPWLFVNKQYASEIRASLTRITVTRVGNTDFMHSALFMFYFCDKIYHTCRVSTLFRARCDVRNLRGPFKIFADERLITMDNTEIPADGVGIYKDLLDVTTRNVIIEIKKMTGLVHVS